MLTCITTHQFKILKQLNQCIKKILPFEFLTTWKDIYINNTLTFLDSNDQNKVYCGIILFHQLSKIYSYESAERKQMYFNIFKSVHNKFLHILSQISNCNDATQCQFIYKIIKIYPKNFNQCQFPNCFESINSFDKFVQYLFYFIQTPINNGVTTHNGDGVLPQWKVKQIVYKFIEVIVNKQFPHSSSKKNLNDVEQYFITKFSEKLILTITTIYSNVSESHKYVDNKCRYYIYYIMASLINKRIYHYKLIEMFSNSNNSNTMLMQIINDNKIPNKELELFVNEPKSYVMNNIDNELSYSTLRNAVYKFVYTLFMFQENREHTNNNNNTSNSNTTLFNIFFPKFLDILTQNEPHVKNEIALATTTTSSHIDTTNIQHNLIKESILYLFQCLNETISAKSPTSIEHIIETFILPEFTSPFGFMRERSCTFIEMLKGHKLHNTTLIINITKSICTLLQNEKSLPVRVMSALAAPTLLQYKNVQHLLRGNIKVLLTLYIKLLNEIGTEEIIECIQEIIKCFSNEVREYTEHLCDYLVKYFISLNKNDNSEMDNILIAKQVILTMVDIVKLFINDNDIYLKIEKYINMIILFTLNKDNITYLEEGIDLIYAVIKKKKTIPHIMWNYYTFLLKGVIDEHTVHKTLNNANSNDNNNNNIRHISVSHSWCCCDNINKVLKIIMYYIIKDNDVFLKDISIDTSSTSSSSTTTTNVTYCQYTVDYVNLLMLLCESDRDYSTMKVLVNILGIMFEKLKGQIEQYVLQYISLIYNKVTNSKCMKSNKYKLILCDLLSHIFIYDPLLLFKNDVHVSTLIINFVIDIIDKSNTKAQYVKNTILLCSMLLAGNNSDIVKLSNEHIVKIVKGIYLLISKSYDMKSKQSYLIDVDNEFEIEAERLKNMNFDVDGDDNYNDYDLNAKVDELEAFCEEVQRKRKYDDTEDDIDDDDDNNNEDDEVYLLGLDDEDEDGDTHEELVCQIMKQNNIIWVKDTLNLIAEKNKQYMCKIKEVCGDDLINKINNVIINEENRIKVGCSSNSNNKSKS